MIKFGDNVFNFDHIIGIKLGKYTQSEEWYVDVHLSNDKVVTKVYSTREEAQEVVNDLVKQSEEVY